MAESLDEVRGIFYDTPDTGEENTIQPCNDFDFYDRHGT